MAPQIFVAFVLSNARTGRVSPRQACLSVTGWTRGQKTMHTNSQSFGQFRITSYSNFCWGFFWNLGVTGENPQMCLSTGYHRGPLVVDTFKNWFLEQLQVTRIFFFPFPVQQYGSRIVIWIPFMPNRFALPRESYKCKAPLDAHQLPIYLFLFTIYNM